jgi:acyl-coenzyme A thioesterase PaaI-like protein
VTAVESRPSLSPAGSTPGKRTLIQRMEAFVSRLSTRNNFWHRVCSLIWLPFAFRSGISMRRIDERRFTAVLPFKRSNRNWYNAMAGAALLGNSEVAAGMYLFARCGSDYEVVCKQMTYRFLRPCYGPAVYHVVNSEDVEAKIGEGGEFNVDLDMEIRQQLKEKGRERRVGRCQITFHCTPKSHVRARAERRARRDAEVAGAATAAGDTRTDARTDARSDA